jgi:hypothetical protein
VAKDFFPLRRGLKLDYRHKVPGKKGTMTFEILATRAAGPVVTAKCVRVFDGKPSDPYEMTRDEAAGWLESSNWGREFPLDPKIGAQWSSGADTFQVDELDAEIDTPAGKFEGCLKITRLAPDGVEERYYAEDVGLVHAASSDENDPYELSLTQGPIRIKGIG